MQDCDFLILFFISIRKEAILYHFEKADILLKARNALFIMYILLIILNQIHIFNV